MNETFDEVVVEHVAALATAFGKQADEATYLAYSLGLGGLSIAQVKSAVARALRASKFMPSPAELRELAGEVSAKARAVLAWDAVKRAIELNGAYRTVEFDDPAINASLLSLGGWPFICEASTADLDKHHAARFEKIYMAFLQRGAVPSSGPLLGLFDRENVARGYKPQEVRRIETGLPVDVKVISSQSKNQASIEHLTKNIGVEK